MDTVTYSIHQNVPGSPPSLYYIITTNGLIQIPFCRTISMSVCLTFVYRNRSCYCIAFRIAFRKNENFHWDGTTHCTPRSSETKPPFRTFCSTSYDDIYLYIKDMFTTKLVAHKHIPGKVRTKPFGYCHHSLRLSIPIPYTYLHHVYHEHAYHER